MKGMKKRKQEMEKNGAEKIKGTDTRREIWKTNKEYGENTNTEEKVKRKKKQKMGSKKWSKWKIQQWWKKVFFVQKEKKDKRNGIKKRKVFCGKKKKKDEWERGQKKKETRIVTTMIISQRGRSKQGIEKNWEKTHT